MPLCCMHNLSSFQKRNLCGVNHPDSFSVIHPPALVYLREVHNFSRSGWPLKRKSIALYSVLRIPGSQECPGVDYLSAFLFSGSDLEKRGCGLDPGLLEKFPLSSIEQRFAFVGNPLWNTPYSRVFVSKERPPWMHQKKFQSSRGYAAHQ